MTTYHLYCVLRHGSGARSVRTHKFTSRRAVRAAYAAYRRCGYGCTIQRCW